MQHRGSVRLETKRLFLRPFTMEDAPAMYRNWASDEAVTKYLTWPAHSTEAVTHEVLAQWTSQYAQPDYYQWAIALRQTPGEPFGCIGVNNAIDDRIKMAHIGYCIGRAWWHRGFTSEALAEVIRFLIREVGVQRVESRHDPRNLNSGAVMKKCGMHYEGTLRRADWNNQGVCDACYYALLACDGG